MINKEHVLEYIHSKCQGCHHDQFLSRTPSKNSEWGPPPGLRYVIAREQWDLKVALVVLVGSCLGIQELGPQSTGSPGLEGGIYLGILCCERGGRVGEE